MRRVKGLFDNDDYEYADRVLVREKGPDRVKEIRYMFSELFLSVPSISLDYFKELCDTAEKYLIPKEDAKSSVPFSIKCRTRSLYAAVLWEKVKDLRAVPPVGRLMCMVEFSENFLSISRSTIIKVCKQLKN